MIAIDDRHLMMIEPTGPPTLPVDDDVTAAARRVLAATVPGKRWRGWHTCSCGERSDSCDHVLPDGTITNSLLVHYVDRHRADVPRDEIAKLLNADRAIQC